ncbi:MAG: sigma 54-interacting transcriptional regulator, partial [Deltaproteobacteria bacterium]|nr:sigma 54-interacting transcriptional regulator [Deltaproteobacteria bacterium]
VAATTVLILGESGTGKEILARHIHRCSPRAALPWVAVNCAALPAELLEGELFGHERGAFTGANERRIGRIEQADRGTLLLDEISELPLTLQAKLLRVLQEREIDRIGGARPIPVDVRVIATSNRSLMEMVARKEFRADLYYRLDVFPIQLPPLRDRRQDIPALADELVRTLSQSLGRQAPELGPAAIRALSTYNYPGNVRQLGNILERALVRCREPVLELAHLDLPQLNDVVAPPAADDEQTGDGSPGAAAAACDAVPSEVARPGDSRFPAGLPVDLPTLERLAIGEALRLELGNRTRAALRLGISLRTLRNKLRAYRTATSAGGQTLPGSDGVGSSRARSATLARPSQSPSSRRAA